MVANRDVHKTVISDEADDDDNDEEAVVVSACVVVVAVVDGAPLLSSISGCCCCALSSIKAPPLTDTSHDLRDNHGVPPTDVCGGRIASVVSETTVSSINNDNIHESIVLLVVYPNGTRRRPR